MRRIVGAVIAEIALAAVIVVGSALVLPVEKSLFVTDAVTEAVVVAAGVFALTALTMMPRRSRSSYLMIAGGVLFYLGALEDLLDEIFDGPHCLGVIQDGLFTTGILLITFGLVAFVRGQRGLLNDVESAKNRLAELSITDGLTGLYNSRHFYDRLNQEILRCKRYGRTLSVMLFDIDDFKRHNDEYGHISGDRVLKRLGETVTLMLRENDSAYRYGGEEFTVMLPETDGAQALVVAERLRERVARECYDLGQPKTISIGVAEYRTGEDATGFVRRADQAMYAAKRAGKNRVESAAVPVEE